MEIPAEDSRVTMGNQTEKKHRFHLKMPQKGRKHSVKKRIAYTFIATMAATLLIIGLINYFFLGSFYIRDKEHILAESFQKLNATGGDSDDIPDTFEQFCVTNNLKVIITGPELSSFVYSNATDRQSLQTLIFGLISGNEQANTKVVDSKDNYQIQKFYDSHADAEYLQIIGWFDNGNCYFARCPLESITDAVGLGKALGLFGILTPADQRLHIGILLAALTDHGEECGLGRHLGLLFALVSCLFQQLQAQYAVEIRQHGALGGAIGLGLEHIIQHRNGHRGIQVVIHGLGEFLLQLRRSGFVHGAVARVQSRDFGNELVKGHGGVIQIFPGEHQALAVVALQAEEAVGQRGVALSLIHI